MKNTKCILFFTVCLSFLFFNCDTETISINDTEIIQQSRRYNYIYLEEHRQLMFLTEDHEIEFLKLLNHTEYTIVEYKSIVERISADKSDEEETEEENEKTYPELEKQLAVILNSITKTRSKISEIIEDLEKISSELEHNDENAEIINGIIYSTAVFSDIDSALNAASETQSPDIDIILNGYFSGFCYLLRNEYRLNFYKSDILILNLENQIAIGIKKDLVDYINNEMIPQLNKILSLYWIGSNGWNYVYYTIQNMKNIAAENDIEHIKTSVFEENIKQ